MKMKYLNYKLFFDKYVLSFLIFLLFFSGKYVLNYSWELIIEHFSEGIFSFYFKTLYRNAAILWENDKNTKLVKSYFLKKNNFLHIIISLIIVLVVIFMFISYSVSRELYLSFHQKITILKPYIKESIQDNLCSKWATMLSYLEYEEIELNLRKTFKENKIRYPISYFSFK